MTYSRACAAEGEEGKARGRVCRVARGRWPRDPRLWSKPAPRAPRPLATRAPSGHGQALPGESGRRVPQDSPRQSMVLLGLGISEVTRKPECSPWPGARAGTVTMTRTAWQARCWSSYPRRAPCRAFVKLRCLPLRCRQCLDSSRVTIMASDSSSPRGPLAGPSGCQCDLRLLALRLSLRVPEGCQCRGRGRGSGACTWQPPGA